MSQKDKGKLSIFLGYAAGVGKTYEMLETAHSLKKEGVDVVAGYIEPHDRPQTSAKMEGLEILPYQKVEYKGIKLREMDLDAVLIRHPQVVLVDELAHTNTPGMRHQKRYEDIEEILNAGIDVYTTVNIQHLESLNDVVGKVSGIHVRETIPDEIFDLADQVKLIDIEPDELIGRMKEGKIYKAAQAERALQNFFARNKLILLREIALRRMADRVNRLAVREQEKDRSRIRKEQYQGEHILTCISPSPSCSRVIRSASRLAYAFQANLTAIYVETPQLQSGDESVRRWRDENIRLAKALGAKIITVFGEDVAYQIAEYARVSGVSKIVLGRTNHRIWLGQKKGTLTDQISEYIPDMDIYIIPDGGRQKESLGKCKDRFGRGVGSSLVRTSDAPTESLGWELIKEAGILAGATLIGMGMRQYGFLDADIIMIYLLGILILSLWTSRRFVSVSAALASVLLFDLLFVDPLYSFAIHLKGYTATFLIMLLFSLIISTIISTGRKQARESTKQMYRTQLLLDNSRRMRRVDTVKGLLLELSGQVLKLMNLPVVFFTIQEEKMAGPWLFPRTGMTKEELRKMVDDQERAVAEWVAANGKRAGCCTHTLPGAKAMYLPIKTSDKTYAVMGIVLEERREIPAFEYGLLTAMVNEAALVFARILKEKEK